MNYKYLLTDCESHVEYYLSIQAYIFSIQSYYIATFVLQNVVC
jgi:hypothetical protein